METVVYKDGSFKHVEHSWEYRGDQDYLVTIPNFQSEAEVAAILEAERIRDEALNAVQAP